MGIRYTDYISAGYGSASAVLLAPLFAMVESLQQQIHIMLGDLIRQLSAPPDRYSLPMLCTRCDQLCVHLNRLAGVDRDQRMVEALTLVREAATILAQATLRSSVQCGRPRYHVTEDQLRHLLSHGFAVPVIAQMLQLGISVSSVRRRMTEYGLSSSSTYSQISDIDLDATVIELKQEHILTAEILKGYRGPSSVSVKHCRGVILTALLHAG